MEIREDLRVEIGKALQWVRKNLALTQYQLAALAQLDYRHFQNIESGRVEVKVETLKRVCETFGFSLSSFFTILENRPWKNGDGQSSKTSGCGQLILFRFEHEHASFRFYNEVRDLLIEWGQHLALGQRTLLNTSPFPCFETNHQGRCIWKNRMAEEISSVQIGQQLELAFVERSHFESFWQSAETFFARKKQSLYEEAPLVIDPNGLCKYYALLGLRLQSHTESSSLFLGCADISAYFENCLPDLVKRDVELTIDS